MTQTLDDRLIRSLQHQAARVGSPSAALGVTAIRRGRRIRRRRQVGALAGVAVLIASTAVVASSVWTDEPGLPRETFATTVDAATWVEGAATSIPYGLGSLIVDGHEEYPPRHDTLVITSLYEIRDNTYLVAMAGEDSTTLFLSDPYGAEPASELINNGLREPAVSTDHGLVAWVVFGGFGSVDAANERWVVRRDLTTGATIDGPEVPEDAAAAGFRDDRVVLTSLGEGPVRLWDPTTGSMSEPGVHGQVVDVRDDLALMTVDGCVLAVDSDWAEMWRDCELSVSPGAISPGGGQVVATLADDTLVFLESRTGLRTKVISGAQVRQDALSRFALRWEGEDDVIFIASAGPDQPRLARCIPSADRCEWAGPPPPYDSAESAVDLVLGHRATLAEGLGDSSVAGQGER